jgi:hypothetical protein
MVAIVRSIPASYGNIPEEPAPSKRGGPPRESTDAHAKDPQAQLEGTGAAVDRRTRAWCPECGVVESIRQIGRSGDVGGRDRVDVKAVGRVSGNGVAADAMTGKIYEMTVRFRDGSTAVFNEASPRTWRLGSRVIVIGGSNASNN